MKSLDGETNSSRVCIFCDDPFKPGDSAAMLTIRACGEVVDDRNILVTKGTDEIPHCLLLAHAECAQLRVQVAGTYTAERTSPEDLD